MNVIATPLFWHRLHNSADSHPKASKSKDLHRLFDFTVDGKTLRMKIKSTPWVLRGSKPSRSMRFKVPDLFEYSFIINYTRQNNHGILTGNMTPEEIISAKLTYYHKDKEYVDHVLMVLLLSV